MPLQLKKVPVDRCDYPSQPRSAFDREECLALGENIKTHGQKVPIIGFARSDRFEVCDGGRRLEAARLVGLAELLALDLGKEPTRAELLMAQASIDLHKQALPPLDRARLFQSLLAEQRWTARQLAESLQVSETLVSRALALLSLPDDLQQQVADGALDASRACVLSNVADPARQRELAALAPSLSREALAAQVRSAGRSDAPSVRVASLKIPLPSGATVSIRGSGQLALEDVVQLLSDTVKEARKAADAKYDVRTWQRIMRDRASAGEA